MRADLDRGKIVDPSVFADPAVVTDNEPPRKLDPKPRLDDHACPDAGAEGSEYSDPRAGAGQAGCDGQHAS
jgi:hypothetical protein